MESEIKLKTRTQRILKLMLIVAWVAFVGYLIKGGSILVAFVISFINPKVAKDLYGNYNLSALREFDIWFYAGAVSFVVTITILQAYVWHLIVKTLTQIKLSNPFTLQVANRLEKMSYILAGTAGIGLLANAYNDWLTKRTGEDFTTWDTNEFMFMAGLVFIISQIFKRGVEIQAENELTV